MTHTLPKGIFKRGNVYALRYSVPTEIRPVVGKKEIVRSLGTSNLVEALGKQRAILEEIKSSLFANYDKIDFVEPKPRNGTTVRATAHRWLTESDGINNATRNRYKSILEYFEKFSNNVEVRDINREMALRFVDHLKTTPSLRTGKLLSHRSLSAYQICLASYWRVLEHWGLVDLDMKNPFSSILRRLPGQKRKVDPRKKNLRPVTRKEAEALLSYISGNGRLKYQHEMYAIVRLLWVTACRLGEIASLSLENIQDKGDHFCLLIEGAKTDAGNRLVVVVGRSDCELLRGVVRRAKITAPINPESKGLLFPRLLRGGYDRSLGHYLGKALEKARKTLPSHDEWDMHSFRRTCVSALINAGVARGERNLVVGHSNNDDIGLSVYAKRGDLHEVIRTTFEALYVKLEGSLVTPMQNG